jgi:fused signal recognition particle receptor
MALFGFGKKKDEKEPPKRGIAGIGQRLRALFRKDGGKEQFYDELEDLLIEADLGGTTAAALTGELKKIAASRGLKSEEDLFSAMRELIRGSVRSVDLSPVPGKLNLYLVLGVNGVGKTTTIAKLAAWFRSKGTSGILFAAADTFRAAAIDQLKIHGERNDFRVVHQEPGSDPAAVIYDSIASARTQGDSVILADTAGRMHNRQDLVRELQKIDKVIKSRLGDDGVYRKILVIDATTGQNGRHQAEVFHEAVGVDGIIMTKYDSSAKGGLIVTIGRDPGLPFAFLGRGEKIGDLVPFDPDTYAGELLSSE